MRWTDIQLRAPHFEAAATVNITNADVVRAMIANGIPPEWVDHAYTFRVVYLETHFFEVNASIDHYHDIDDERHRQLDWYGEPPAIPQWDGWRMPTSDDLICLHVLIVHKEAQGQVYMAKGLDDENDSAVAQNDQDEEKKQVLQPSEVSDNIFTAVDKEHVRTILKDLPNDVDPKIKGGLLAAHQKLSQYYYHFDQSPFYTWAAFLDPCITYKGLKEEYPDDKDLSAYLEDAKRKLQDYYQANYASQTATLFQAQSPLPPTNFSFTACYKNKSRQILNKLDDSFKLTPESFDTCNPLKWWFGRRAQYPNLYCIARDILAIPGQYTLSVALNTCSDMALGSAVAVERISQGAAILFPSVRKPTAVCRKRTACTPRRDVGISKGV
ncbi:hypothetical protein C0992_006217 [Termitomyces sp. T32_za158]|nr:hypothetical protein C0992_006217 [Termitomyces sp. T32_za158]